MAQATLVNVQQAILDAEAHIKKCGGAYPQWYAGVASDAQGRLHNEHNVPEKGSCWLFRNLATDNDARQVEDYFLRKGCDGGSGGGDWTSKSFYIYKKISGTTRP